MPAPPHHFPVLLLLVPILVGVEYLWFRFQGRTVYDAKESLASLVILAGQIATRALTSAVLLPIFWFVHEHRLLTIERSFWTLAALFLASEFFYYWFHRASHGVRWLWATHSVHHSITRLNFSAAYRLGWTGLISAGWIFYLPLVWLGFTPVEVFAVLGLNLAYQFFLHTELPLSLGPLEWLLNSPRHHRVHHALNASCLDRNFGGVLIVFDRLFGTFARRPQDEALTYGLGGPPSYNPVRIALGEWARLARDCLRARSIGGAFKLAFGRPCA